MAVMSRMKRIGMVVVNLVVMTLGECEMTILVGGSGWRASFGNAGTSR